MATENLESWVGVDLDGTIAHYDGWKGATHIGDPIHPMVDRVRKLLADGNKVKIFTARVTRENFETLSDYNACLTAIEDWCEMHLGQRLEITNVKDFGMIQLFDDRCIRVETNTGVVCCI